MIFNLKGKASIPGPRWEEGFKEAYEITLIGLPMTAGKYGSKWGSGGNTKDGGEYGNGFAEGSTSGRGIRWRLKEKNNQILGPEIIDLDN